MQETKRYKKTHAYKVYFYLVRNSGQYLIPLFLLKILPLMDPSYNV